MRLIDADKLKEQVNNKQVVGRFNVLILIDEAPTIKPERPKGEWVQTEIIDDDSDYGINADASECSNCKHIESSHYWTTTYYNFCPNCGADMRGKEE